MQFTHDFADDLEQLDFFADEPWAFIRLGDGEALILAKADLVVSTGWSTNVADDFRTAFVDSTGTNGPEWDGMHVGISCPCCDPPGAKALKRLMLTRLPEDRLTFANIFANANYDRFRQRCMQEKFGARCAIVGSAAACHYDIPSNIVNHPDAMKIIDETVAKLKDEHRTILVAAGPASNIIIHRYWTTCPVEKRRVICDIGSALDPWLHGRFTRGYHDPSHPNRKKVCVWNLTKTASTSSSTCSRGS